jgi:hypothetical protein
MSSTFPSHRRRESQRDYLVIGIELPLQNARRFCVNSIERSLIAIALIVAKSAATIVGVRALRSTNTDLFGSFPLTARARESIL